MVPLPTGAELKDLSCVSLVFWLDSPLTGVMYSPVGGVPAGVVREFVIKNKIPDHPVASRHPSIEGELKLHKIFDKIVDFGYFVCIICIKFSTN